MNRQFSLLISPPVALASGFTFLTGSGILLFFTGFFINSDFFQWGPPVNIMGQDVTSNLTFYLLLVIFFGHQLINCWISQVVYPYIINEIQNVNEQRIRYQQGALIISILFAIYSNLDLLIIINGTYSQISFFLMILLANSLSVGFINYMYLHNKNQNRIVAITDNDQL